MAAIEGIKGAVMTQQVPKKEVVAPVESAEKIQVEPKTNVQPVASRDSGYDPKENPNRDFSGQDQLQYQKNDENKNLQEVSAEKVKSALAEINKKIAPTRTTAEFKYHEKTHRISITVRDKDTDEVIREIPPEKTLDMLAKTLELAGILVDEKR